MLAIVKDICVHFQKVIFWLSVISVNLWIKLSPYNILFEPLKTLYESVQWSIEKWNFRFHLGFLHVSILDFCCPLSFLYILWYLQSSCKDYSSLKLAWIRFWFPRTKIFQPCTLSGEIFRNIELLLFLILDSFSFPVLFIFPCISFPL